MQEKMLLNRFASEAESFFAEEAPTLVRRLDPRQIARRWKQELGVDVGPRFESIPWIYHWRSEASGLEWYTPLEAAGDSKLYSQLEKFHWYYMQDKWEFRTALKYLRKRDRVLEVGAGSGHFMDIASARGVNIEGIELNAVAVARARQKNLVMHEVDLESFASQNEDSFDRICSFQVLEHLTDPKVFFAAARRLLRPGGDLIVSVPNAAVMGVIDVEKHGLLDQPPHHMSHWDSRAFNLLQERVGLRLRKLRREPLQPYHIDWFINCLFGRLCKSSQLTGFLIGNRAAIKLAAWLCRKGLRLVVPGHTLLVVLRKPE